MRAEAELKRAFKAAAKFYKIKLTTFLLDAAIEKTNAAIAQGLKIKPPRPPRDARRKSA